MKPAQPWPMWSWPGPRQFHHEKEEQVSASRFATIVYNARRKVGTWASEQLSRVVECDRYVPGGFHPVHLDEYHNDRYDVLRKICHGRYTTVWLVRNQQANVY
ncbi:hypothetical protein O988_06445 [Pseudogymnoascus sp. VKM F-3808]|nr:hypothetical protein O988_06445 [Pseudogymnoascus sp. VKM F-3808]